MGGTCHIGYTVRSGLGPIPFRLSCTRIVHIIVGRLVSGMGIGSIELDPKREPFILNLVQTHQRVG